MITVLTLVGGIIGLFVLFSASTRVLMAVKTAGLKGKAASMVYKPSVERISSGKKTVLYFYTPSCGACRMQDPILRKLPDKSSEMLFKIDAAQNEDAASAYGVLSVPFFVFIDKGVIVKASAGVQNETSLSAFFAS